MFGLNEVLMMSAVVVQGVVVLGIAYFGVRMMHRYGFGHRNTKPAANKPLGL
jgi:uncharacterized membrane protein YecN with MAPEG domain